MPRAMVLLVTVVDFWVGDCKPFCHCGGAAYETVSSAYALQNLQPVRGGHFTGYPREPEVASLI